MSHPAWRALFIAAVCFTLYMAWNPHPPHVPISNDKIQHSLAFATLAILAAIAFPATPLPRIGERLSFLGALIEVVQSIPSLHRDCDIFDWIADTVAIALALLVFWLVRRSLRRHARD
jgi:VanZ family protein